MMGIADAQSKFDLGSDGMCGNDGVTAKLSAHATVARNVDWTGLQRVSCAVWKLIQRLGHSECKQKPKTSHTAKHTNNTILKITKHHMHVSRSC